MLPRLYLTVVLLMAVIAPPVMVLSIATPTAMVPAATIQKPAAFHRHSCFHRNGIREKWESNLPDGIIEQVGYRQYLVMFQGEAEKRGGGDKVALPLTIELFDAAHHEVECPLAWLNHNKRGVRDAKT